MKTSIRKIIILFAAALLPASLFAQSSLTLNFETDGNTQGFRGTNVTGLEASGGLLRGRAVGGDPQLIRSSISATATPIFRKASDASWDKVEVRVRETDGTGNTVDHTANGILVVLNVVHTGVETVDRLINSTILSAVPSGEGFYTIIFDISGYTADDIRWFRVDPIGGPDSAFNPFEVDYITITVDGEFEPVEVELVQTAPMVDALPNGVFTATFNQNVTPANGNLVFHRADDDSVVETIDVTSGNVTVNGSVVTVSPETLDFGTSYYVLIDSGAFTPDLGSAFAGISDPEVWTFTTFEAAPTLLFADFFERPAGSDLNASNLGKFGSLGALTYTSRVIGLGNIQISNGDLLIQSNEAAGASGGIVYLNHNFTDPVIPAGGGFSVTVEIKAYATAGSGRQMSVGVGQSSAQLNALAGAHGPGSVGDLVVSYRNTTSTLEIWKNGTLDAAESVTGGLPTPPTTLRIDYEVADFQAGSTVSYSVHFDDSETAFTTGSFVWSGTNENYISLSSNLFQNSTPGVRNSIFDNLQIHANAVPIPKILKISQSDGMLDFEWSSSSGKQYDLVSNTDLSTSPSTWSPYNDGTRIYENIFSIGNATQTLTGVEKLGSRRFFALVEKNIQSLHSEDFESGDGGYTATVEAGTAWEHGEPDSTGFGGQSVSSGNGGSANAWGIGIGNPGHYVSPTTQSCLRSTVIDLTNVPAATLTFAQVLDFPAADSGVVRIINVATGDPIETGLFPLTIADDDVDSANWQMSGPHELPVGVAIRIEWCFSGTGGTTADYMGWYIDDVVVQPVTD